MTIRRVKPGGWHEGYLEMVCDAACSLKVTSDYIDDTPDSLRFACRRGGGKWRHVESSDKDYCMSPFCPGEVKNKATPESSE